MQSKYVALRLAFKHVCILHNNADEHIYDEIGDSWVFINSRCLIKGHFPDTPLQTNALSSHNIICITMLYRCINIYVIRSDCMRIIIISFICISFVSNIVNLLNFSKSSVKQTTCIDMTIMSWPWKATIFIDYYTIYSSGYLKWNTMNLIFTVIIFSLHIIGS